MALPKDIRTLFNELPRARAERDAQQKQRVLDREEATKRLAEERAAQRASLKAQLAVAWDWLQQDGQELAAEMRKAGFGRLELLGPLTEEGLESPWQVGSRGLVLLDDGQLEIVRYDDFRTLRYLAHTADELLDIEPPAVTRAFIEAIRTGSIWQRVGQQLRESTATPVEE